VIAYRSKQPYRIRGVVRLAGWIVTAVPTALMVDPRLALAAPLALESIVFVAGATATWRAQRRVPPLASGPNDGPPEAGVREPRRPLPFAGAGAMAIPEP